MFDTKSVPEGTPAYQYTGPRVFAKLVKVTYVEEAPTVITITLVKDREHSAQVSARILSELVGKEVILTLEPLKRRYSGDSTGEDK